VVRRSLNRRVLELEANVNDLTEVQQQMSSDENAVSAEARKRLTEQLERSQKLESTLQKTQQQVDELDNKLQVTRHRASTSMYSLTFCVRVATPAQYGRNETAWLQITSRTQQVRRFYRWFMCACVRSACGARLAWRITAGSATHLYLYYFWETVYKTVRPMLSDHCLSVMLVYCGQTVGWIKMKFGMVGLGPGHIVLDGDPPPPPHQRAQQPPNFWSMSFVVKRLVGSRCHLVQR